MYQPYLNFIISSACSSTCFCNGFSSGCYHTHYMACNICSMQKHTFLLFLMNVHVWLKFSTTKHHYENEKIYNIETKINKIMHTT